MATQVGLLNEGEKEKIGKPSQFSIQLKNWLMCSDQTWNYQQNAMQREQAWVQTPHSHADCDIVESTFVRELHQQRVGSMPNDVDWAYSVSETLQVALGAAVSAATQAEVLQHQIPQQCNSSWLFSGLWAEMSCEGADAHGRADSGSGGRGDQKKSILCPTNLMAYIVLLFSLMTETVVYVVCCGSYILGVHMSEAVNVSIV